MENLITVELVFDMHTTQHYFEDLGINYVAVRDDNNSIIRKVVVR